MSTALQKQTTTLAERRAEMARVASEIDRISETGVMAFSGAGGKLAEEITAAQAMVDLRELLSDDMMRPIMGLMNTQLGFLTDRNPNAAWEPKDPYPPAVVRDVFIESRLRGFHVLGNEFNIIGGRFYACVNGFRRRLTDGKTFPGLSEFSDDYSVPEMRGDGAVVKCSATWKMNGVPASVKREFPIRVNKGMGADAILGKAQRKLLKVVHDRVSGIQTPDGEVGEEPLKQAKQSSEPTEPQFTRPATRHPDPTDAPPGAEVPAKPQAQTTLARDLKTLRMFLKDSKHDEAALLQIWRDKGAVDASLASLDEVAEMQPSAIHNAINPWSKTLEVLSQSKPISV